MAFGQAWKSWDENLHPRDRRGRFAKKWGFAKSLIQKLDKFLDAFTPRMFQNDQQASQYLFNRTPTRWGRDEYARLHMDLDEANEHLRTGDMDDETKKFVQMMDAHKVVAEDDLIVSRTVTADAFGLTPDQLGLEDGGIEDFTGKLLADRAYAPAHIGGILGTSGVPGPGKITMRIAVPKGTPIIPFARSRDDRGLSLDRDQEFRVTKVQPDGSGGWYMAVVATPRTKGDTPDPINLSPRGVGLTPEQRAERVRSRAQMRSPAEIREEEQAQRRIAMGQAAQGPAAEARAKRLEDLRLRQVEEPAPVPQRTEELPKGVEPRNEPVAPTPGEVPTPTPEPAGVPPAAAPVLTPDQFRQAFRDAGIPSPSYGPRRREFNDALLGIGTGKKDPFDALRDLERDIEVNQNKQKIQPDSELEADIKAQQRLADLIREQYNVPGRERAPEVPAPEPAKAVKRAVSSQGGTKAAGLTPEQQESVRNRVTRMKSEGKFNPDNPEHQRLQSLVDQMEGAKAPAKKAAPVKAPAAKAPAAPAKKAAPEAVPEVRPVSARQMEVLRRASKTAKGRFGIDPRDLTNDNIAELKERGLVRTKSGPDGAEVILTPAGRKFLKDLDVQSERRRVEAAAKKAPPEVPAPAKAAEKVAKKATPLKLEPIKAEPVKQIAVPKAAKKAAKKVAAPEAPGEKPLEKNTIPELRKIAQTEGVELKSKMLKADIVKAIQAKGIREAMPEAPAPVKKVAKKAVPEAPIEKSLEKNTVSELRKIALDENVDLPKRATKAQIVKAIQDQRTEGPPEERLARARQADFDRVRPTAKALTRLVEFQSKGSTSKRAYEHTVRSVGRDLGPEFTEEALRRGPGGNLDDLIGRFERDNNLTRVGQVGDVVPYNYRLHGDVPGMKSGDPVEIVAPAYRYRRLSDDEVTLVPARVISAPGERFTRVPERRAKKLVPEGSVPGPVTQTPIQTSERKANFKEAWDDAGFKTPGGSAGRSMREIRDDISSGKITPEEGVRRMESEIALNQEELGDIDATLRGQMPPAERRKLIAQAEELEAAIEEQKKASSFMRGHFEQEAPVSGVKELKKLTLEVPPETRKALDNVEPEALKDEAVRQGLERPKGDTVDEIIQDMTRQIAKQELTRRVQEGAEAARALKKAVPKKTAPTKVAPVKAVPKVTPGKLDARTIAQGLEIDDKTLADVQRALDGDGEGLTLPKNPSGPAIAKRLRMFADRRRSTGAISYGNWSKTTDPKSPNFIPEARADNDRQREQLYREADQLAELADRIEFARRPRKAPEPPAPAKVIRTPEERKALVEAGRAELQDRITQGALSRLSQAKNRGQVDDALAGMTVPEVRRVAEQHGIMARTRKQLVDGIAERYLGAPEAPAAPVKAAKKAAPAKRTVAQAIADSEAPERASIAREPVKATPLKQVAKKQAAALREATGRPAARPLSGNPEARRLQLDNRVREAYRDLRSPGEWVGLADLREHPALSGLTRQEQDEAILGIIKFGDDYDSTGKTSIRLIPIANRKALTERDRAAAVHLGGEDMNAVLFGNPSPRSASTGSRPATPSQTEGPGDTEARRLVDQVEESLTHQAARAKIRGMGLDDLRLIAQDKGVKDWQNLPKPALAAAIIDAMELFDPDER